MARPLKAGAQLQWGWFIPFKHDFNPDFAFEP